MNIVMLSIKTSGDFYLFYDFPYGRILMLFMEVPGYFKYFLFSNAKHVLKRIKNQYYTQILFFNNNDDFLIFNEDFKHNIF